MKILVIWQMKDSSAMKTKQSDSKDAHWFVLAVRALSCQVLKHRAGWSGWGQEGKADKRQHSQRGAGAIGWGWYSSPGSCILLHSVFVNSCLNNLFLLNFGRIITAPPPVKALFYQRWLLSTFQIRSPGASRLLQELRAPCPSPRAHPAPQPCRCVGSNSTNTFLHRNEKLF